MSVGQDLEGGAEVVPGGIIAQGPSLDPNHAQSLDPEIAIDPGLDRVPDQGLLITIVIVARAALEVAASLQLGTGAAVSLERQKTMEKSVLLWMKIKCSRAPALVVHVVVPKKRRGLALPRETRR